MNWKTLLSIAVLLAVVMAVGFGYEQPLVGLIALILLLAIGVYTLYRLSLEEPRKKGRKKR
jgi:hypothetical protein